MDTYGCILGPLGQGVVITVIVRFLDPDNYRNSIYINMHYGKRIVSMHILIIDYFHTTKLAYFLMNNIFNNLYLFFLGNSNPFSRRGYAFNFYTQY